MEIKKKFGLALAAYAALAILVWKTLSDEPIRIFEQNIRLRTATLIVLGLFTLRAGLYFWRVRIENADEGHKDPE